MIITVKPNGVRVLTPEEPFTWLTNESEDLFSQSVSLGVKADPNAWRDATEEEHEEWQRRHEEEPQEEEII